MFKPTSLILALTAAAAAPSFAGAQAVSWTTVIADNASVTVPGLPSATRWFTDDLLGDVGAGQIGARLSDPGTAAGYWAMKQGAWVQYTKLGVAGATLGPGRSGAEAGHVFLDVSSGGSGAGPDGQRALVARAGAAGDATTATWGVWRWNGSGNVEVVRGLTDGDLGPNMGNGWTWQNTSSTYSYARAMNAGRMLVNGYVTTSSAQSRLYLAMAVPGQRVTPCAMKDSTNPAVAPGLAAGDSFDITWSGNDFSVTPDNRVYGALHATNGRDGIWKLCEGAPRALVVDDEQGTGDAASRGPDVGVATAVFGSFEPAHPGYDDNFYFFAYYREQPSGTSKYGLFWHGAGGNRALARNETSGAQGPGWPDGATWGTFNNDTLTSAGDWVAFRASMNTSDGGSPSGIWRVRAGGSPQIVALLGLTGTYGPEPNRTWDAFYGSAVLANGDIVVEARTQPGSEYAIWLLKTDGSKQRLLKAGTTVSVPTSGGTLQATVGSYDVPGGAAAYSRGGDSWIGADGTLLIDVNLNTYGHALVTAKLPNPSDRIFRNGFDR